MERNSELWAIALSTMMLSTPSVLAQSITGRISVWSGSEFLMTGPNITVRLYGIEACALDQVAHFNGVAWRCGVVSAGWLTQLTLGYEVKCLEEQAGGYATIFARCFLPSGEDIARLALEQGMAWAARDNGLPIEGTYGLIEDEARNKKTGIWSSNFEHGGAFYRTEKR